VSEENLEIVRRIWEDWSRGDFSAVDWADPEILFIGSGSTAPEENRGIEEMARAWADWLGTMSDFRTEAVGWFHEGDQVVVFNRFSGSGRASGLPLEDWPGAVRFEIRNAKVVVMQLYTDRKQALREAGIDPEAAGA
jgi:ketosteroid isomerase-like protein